MLLLRETHSAQIVHGSTILLVTILFKAHLLLMSLMRKIWESKTVLFMANLCMVHLCLEDLLLFSYLEKHVPSLSYITFPLLHI